MKYQKPEAQIVIFDNSDIITASGGCTTNTSTFADDYCVYLIKGIVCIANGYDNKNRKNQQNGPNAGPNDDPFANM